MIGVIVAFGVGLVLSLGVTPLYIRFLVAHHFGQFIRQDGPTEHLAKRGTPTMGGVVFILAAVLAWLAGCLFNGHMPDWSSTLLVVLFVGLGVIGLLDDGIKIRKERSLGLHAGAKIALQLLVGTVFAVLALTNPDEHGITPGSTAISVTRPTSADLDGLATGSSIFVIGAYLLIAMFQRTQSCWGNTVNVANCSVTRDPLGLAVFCAALIGALIGFLWWNASPAQIFMGDTGSLALGGAVAGLSILTNTEFLAVVIGGLFVVITMSDVIQIGVFKATHKRVFRMAPLHHHFELKGWKEITIVVRFWIVAALFAAVGVGIFYAEWAAQL